MGVFFSSILHLLVVSSEAVALSLTPKKEIALPPGPYWLSGRQSVGAFSWHRVCISKNMVGVDREFTLMILGSPIGLWRLADGGFLFIGIGFTLMNPWVNMVAALFIPPVCTPIGIGSMGVFFVGI